ncbi:hypothetical protein P171DRAFT_486048 [Karstenula rhodostoma CBS 690.94]|uniref:Uncharacterized protein n=1 Tax=Karstenula rhodostoma CBS 690.94 TaxID=1392251 RepID=A0A9P4PE02_9PLEO|nr:hypothetical protein P171DRAFT_486048 [Karstenula rhodostoma CBS 690.94]
MRSAKKRPKNGSSPLVIGSPQDFKKGTETADLLLGVGVPTPRGGFDTGSGKASRSESPDDDEASVLSLTAFAMEYRLPPRTSSMEPPPRAHQHTAPPKILLPNPLRLNPPEPVRSPPPPAVELEGSSPPISTTKIRSRGNNNNEALKSNHHSVIYGDFETGSPFFPIIEQGEDMPLPEPRSSDSSGQVTPIARPRGQNTPKAANQARSSRLPAIGPLPLEMREPLKIWQKYTRTGIIDVDICPEAIDGDGNYTWMHCWGLFNLYTFGASFMNDTEFADRVMDMLCGNLKPGKAADVDTICLLFSGENIASRLKQLVVDRCIDGELKNFSRSITKYLPHEFAAVALEAAMERLANSEWRQRLESPCRYHRHKRDEDCYLRKFANERDRRIIDNRKRRKSQASTQVCFELDTAEPKKSAVEGTNGNEPPVKDEAIPARSNEQKVVNDREDQSSTTSEPVSIASVQEADLETDESSVIAALGLEDPDVSTAKSCEIFKPAGTVFVVDVTNTPHPDTESLAHCSKSSQESRRGPPVLDTWLSLSQSNSSEELLLPGAYPKAFRDVAGYAARVLFILLDLSSLRTVREHHTFLKTPHKSLPRNVTAHYVTPTPPAPTVWLLRFLEFCLGRLLYRRRGYDADLVFNTAPFKLRPKPTLAIDSPDCGPPGARLRDEHSAFGAGRILRFTWPAAASNVKELHFLAEDPDAPLGHANVHGMYLGILPTTTSLAPEDLEVLGEENGMKVIKSGWRVGKNRREQVYIPARPPRDMGRIGISLCWWGWVRS